MKPEAQRSATGVGGYHGFGLRDSGGVGTIWRQRELKLSLAVRRSHLGGHGHTELARAGKEAKQ